MNVALLGSGMLPVPPQGYGAVERHVGELADALRRRGHDVTVLSRVFGRGPIHEYRFARWALRETRRLRPDVVHAHTTGVAAVFAAARRRFVYTSHSRHWMSAEGLREKAGFALERYAVRRATRVVALTGEVAEKMGREATVIPNGVDPASFAPRWDARTGRRALAVGALVPHKNHHLAAVAAKEAGFALTIVGPGGGPYADRLRALGAEVRSGLSDPALASLYADSDVFLHLSHSEALSLAVLEAMASGLPLVASDACRGQVVEGETGFPIPTIAPDDARVAAARAALGRLAGDAALRRRLGEGARARAVRDYAWPVVAARVEGVYREVAP